MSASLKILVFGDVEGRFDQFFKRIKTTNEKNGPFNMVLCVGNFFSEDHDNEQWLGYLCGDKQVPVPTFIINGPGAKQGQYYEQIPHGGSLCENVTYLGKSGIFKTMEGLSIGYISGGYNEKVFKSSYESELEFNYTQTQLKKLIQSTTDTEFKGVDILLTSEWPKGVTRGAPVPKTKGDKTKDMFEREANITGEYYIRELVQALKPRYHFAAKEGIFYERVPYRNAKLLTAPTHVTRFLALGSVSNPAKHRSLYAFNAEPMSKMKMAALLSQPPSTTDFPFVDESKESENKPSLNEDDATQGSFFFAQKRKSGGAPPKGYVCKLCNVPGHLIRDCELAGAKRQRVDGEETPRKPVPDGYICKLCNTPGHWLQNCELAGKRNTPHKRESQQDCWFCLKSPEVAKHMICSIGEHFYVAIAKGPLVENHMLILPINHVACSVDLSDEEKGELEKYKKMLRNFYNDIGMSCILYERNIASRHMQIQVIPIPKTFDENHIREAFVINGNNSNITLEECELKNLADNSEYFLVEFENGKGLIHRKTGRFPLQFGRQVLASPHILNCPDKVDWKNCGQEKEEEASLAKALRAKLKKFAFDE